MTKRSWPTETFRKAACPSEPGAPPAHTTRSRCMPGNVRMNTVDGVSGFLELRAHGSTSFLGWASVGNEWQRVVWWHAAGSARGESLRKSRPEACLVWCLRGKASPGCALVPCAGVQHPRLDDSTFTGYFWAFEMLSHVEFRLTSSEDDSVLCLQLVHATRREAEAWRIQ